MTKEIHVGTGCYGGNRGHKLAILTQAALAHKGISHIQVHGFGHPNFAKGKENLPIPQEHLDALEQVAGEYRNKAPWVRAAYEQLKNLNKRTVATHELLNELHEYHPVDDFMAGQYYKLQHGREPTQNSEKVPSTVLTGAGLVHHKWGTSLDDTETPNEHTLEETIPLIEIGKAKKEGRQYTGKKPRGIPKHEYNWHSMNGETYKAGSEEARLQEARDLVEISHSLASRLAEKYPAKAT